MYIAEFETGKDNNLVINIRHIGNTEGPQLVFIYYYTVDSVGGKRKTKNKLIGIC